MRGTRWQLGAGLGAIALALTLAALQAAPASAQSWWPFGNDEPRRAPVPREGMRQPVPAPIPEPAPPPAGAANNWATKNPICLQLEQRLVQEGAKGNQSRDQLPKLEAEIRTVDRTFNASASQLDARCYETFLFTRTFRNTSQCKDLARQVEVAKRRLADLEAQRQDLMGSAGRSYKDDIVRELARNNCGANYVDQARRQDGGGGFWTGEDAPGTNSWTPSTSTGGTYRTVCVRLCDGFYFPVSFATLPSHFAQDAEACSSKCSAPTALYYHPNPGGGMDQAVSLQSSEPYTNLKVAFRYRKEYVNGCSCKEAEYVPATTADQKAEGGAATKTPRTSAAPARRAGAAVPEDGITTGSTAQDDAWAPQPQ